MKTILSKHLTSGLLIPKALLSQVGPEKIFLTFLLKNGKHLGFDKALPLGIYTASSSILQFNLIEKCE